MTKIDTIERSGLWPFVCFTKKQVFRRPKWTGRLKMFLFLENWLPNGEFSAGVKNKSLQKL